MNLQQCNKTANQYTLEVEQMQKAFLFVYLCLKRYAAVDVSRGVGAA